jgi:uncharacterized protein
MSDAVAPALTADLAAPVTAAERIAAIDVVRGLAMLGILVMNVVEFGQPIHAYDNPAVAGGYLGWSLYTWFAQVALFDGKMRALFSLLFGAGMVLIAERMERKGQGARSADILLRRCLWMVAFGIVHRFLLQWTGDILYQYGLLGLIAVPFRRLRPRTLIVIGLLTLTAFTPMGLRTYVRFADIRDKAAVATSLAAKGATVPPDNADARKRWDRVSASLTDRNAKEAREANAKENDKELTNIRGSYLDVFTYRWDYHHEFQSGYLYYYFVFDVLGMLFIGMGLLKLGFFAGNLPTRSYVAIIGAGALVAGASLWWAIAWKSTGFVRSAIGLRLLHDCLYPFARGIVGLAWASALILLVRAGAARWLTAPLAAVGRMAFTCYILQTLCCTLFFFGYGLGFYGQLSRAQLMLVVAGVSVLQIAFSMLWLRAYRFGPLEWCWRSLTYWHRQPMRREAEA